MSKHGGHHVAIDNRMLVMMAMLVPVLHKLREMRNMPGDYRYHNVCISSLTLTSLLYLCNIL